MIEESQSHQKTSESTCEKLLLGDITSENKFRKRIRLLSMSSKPKSWKTAVLKHDRAKLWKKQKQSYGYLYIMKQQVKIWSLTLESKKFSFSGVGEHAATDQFGEESGNACKSTASTWQFVSVRGLIFGGVCCRTHVKSLASRTLEIGQLTHATIQTRGSHLGNPAIIISKSVQ